MLACLVGFQSHFKVKGDTGHSVSTAGLWQAVDKTLFCSRWENKDPRRQASLGRRRVSGKSSPGSSLMCSRRLRMRAFLFTWPHPFLLPLATYSLETDCPLGFRWGPPGPQRVPTPAPKKTQKRSSAWENLGEERSAEHLPLYPHDDPERKAVLAVL